MRTLAALALVSVVLHGAGCLQETRSDVAVLVFEYTLSALDDEARTAYPGEHCGTAKIGDDIVKIDKRVWAEIGRPGKLVVVDATLRARWDTVGDEPFPLGLPGAVDPHVDGFDDPEPIADFDWKRDVNGVERAWVDGDPVELPAEVEYTSKDGRWKATGVLSKGPSVVKTYGPVMCD